MSRYAYPLGDTLRSFDVFAEDDEAAWQRQFAVSADMLIEMVNEALRDDEAGLTWSIDPKTDKDDRGNHAPV